MAGLNKAELKVLERIFASEVKMAMSDKGYLPVQLRSKHLRQLQARGYVESVKVTLKGYPPCTVEGWALTHRGNLAYCESCKDVKLPEENSTKNAHLKSHAKRAPRQRSGA